MKKLHYLALLLIACLPAAPVMAFGLYVEGAASVLSGEDTIVQVRPVVSKVTAGVEITPHYMIEVQSIGNGDETDAGSGASLQIGGISAAYLRLDSGLNAGMRMYFLVGQAETTLSATGINGFTASETTYSDFSWGVGIEDRILFKYLFLTVSYTEYYKENDTKLSSGSIGVKLAF
ncbi:MAG: outer membrane beta-barrel protein [Gammaproteobacteria bacterium]|nr:outer membrane beta-barrel protein [Gammaproteobacteria bacterium]MDH5650451.1 outer membrane beta-barrel protein [Gammaproteobacteria bacterium]